MKMFRGIVLLLAVTLAVLLVAATPAAAETFGRKWEIHLIHHTHFDIGYTHPQEEVLRRQWKFIDQSLDLIDKTKTNPKGAQFVWNPENNYATEAWINQASPANRARFIAAVKSGNIGLSADFANMLWELCRPAELNQAFAYKYELERLTGVTVDSAMLSDVPGVPWGLVSAMAQNGVRYFSIGPNRGDRIGYVLKDWSDKPFWWTSPSGRDRVLVFIHGKGYSWFHAGGENWDKLPLLFTEGRIFPYLKDLEKSGYPYAIIPIRYNVGADNGPPDPRIADAIKAWNEKNPNVQVKITTVSESFREFETRYGDKLPTFTGDFSPYWPDGAASTARETGWVRNAGERLTQAATIQSLVAPAAFPAADFHLAWNNVLLYNEHTWGAWSSISAPDSEFTRTQWEWKKNTAVVSDKMSADLLGRAAGQAAGAGAVTLINTNSFAITVPVTVKSGGATGVDGAPAQVRNGEDLTFIATIPGLAAQTFNLKNDAAPTGACKATATSISNGRFELTLEPISGAIKSLKRLADGREFVNKSYIHPFNDYIYIRARRPQFAWVYDTTWILANPAARAKVTVKDSGPLVCSVEIDRPAPGSNSLITTITMYDGLDRIDIVNTLDRPVQRRPEGIHFAFPVAAQNPRVRYDVAWGVVEVDKDQLKGSCKNFMTPVRWVDVSGDDVGLMIVLQDAPEFEAGAITNDAKRVGWLRETKHNGIIYSWPMNNYWHTNYKADQPGVTAFRYSVFPHDAFDPVANNKNALSVMQPPVPAAAGTALVAPLATGNDSVIIEAVQPSPLGEGLMIDLANLSDRDQSVSLSLSGQCPAAYLLKDGRELVKVDGALKFGKYDMLRLVCK